MDITGVKNFLSRKFRGASLDDVQGISNYSVFFEAAANLLANIDPLETVRHSEVNLFNNIFDYSLPSDFKKMIDPRKQVDRFDDFSRTYIEDFDREKQDQTFSVEFDEATKFLRLSRNLSYSTNVDDMSATTGWTAAGGGTNLAVDTILFAEAGASLRFDLGATGGYLEKSTLTSLDLSSHVNKSSLFRWIYFPDSSFISSVSLRIGSSSANYYTITGTIHRGSIRTGWNLYRFDWNGATQTGTVTSTAIVYERLTIVSTSADTDIRLGRLSSKLPYPYELVYYSNCLFRPASGSTWLTTPTQDTDIVNLENEALTLFLYECEKVISEDMQKGNDAEKVRRLLYGTPGDRDDIGLYAHYKTDKPSEQQKAHTIWYRHNKIRRAR